MFLFKAFFILVLLFIGGSYFKAEKKSSELKRYMSDEVRKGAELEEKIKNIAEGRGFKVLSNIIIPNLTGKTTEIDVVLLSRKGFYVIEAKNYFGFVAGNKSWKKWVVTYNKKKGIKRTFLNPINQNLRHIYALRKMFPRFRFENLVVFGENAPLANELYQTSNVKTYKKFEYFICNTLPKKDDVLTEEEVESVYNFLTRYKDGDKEAHIQFVKSLKKEIKGN